VRYSICFVYAPVSSSWMAIVWRVAAISGLNPQLVTYCFYHKISVTSFIFRLQPPWHAFLRFCNSSPNELSPLQPHCQAVEWSLSNVSKQTLKDGAWEAASSESRTYHSLISDVTSDRPDMSVSRWHFFPEATLWYLFQSRFSEQVTSITFSTSTPKKSIELCATRKRHSM
jgi:hypothetical protein